MSIVAAVVDVTSFITLSDASKEVFKTATLLKTLGFNALIGGEVGVGKRTLAEYILPQAVVLDGVEYEQILLALSSSSEIIITNIDKSPNLNKVLQLAKENDVRVVATTKTIFRDDFFSVNFSIPPLSQRLEDVDMLIDRFLSEANLLFGAKEGGFEGLDFEPDLSENSHSLRRQIMVLYLLEDIKDFELMDIIQKYLFKRLGSNGDYRKFLYLYEAPLIKAGLKKFKSQLQLSQRLGLNRNTLRKKISDNKNYLEKG